MIVRTVNAKGARKKGASKPRPIKRTGVEVRKRQNAPALPQVEG